MRMILNNLIVAAITFMAACAAIPNSAHSQQYPPIGEVWYSCDALETDELKEVVGDFGAYKIYASGKAEA